MNCSAEDVAHLAAVARGFCPYPDYSPGPLYNMLSANSSQVLSEHYTAVQASLTPQQQQDFTQSLRSTFGDEGKVLYGGAGLVALSLAVLFDAVARQVKGEYVSDQEPIPGLFLKEPSGDYSPPVYIISKYLRLVPHIANNPTRMADKTEKYLVELKRELTDFVKTVQTQELEDISGVNALRCAVIGHHMTIFLKNLTEKIIDLDDIFNEPIKHTDQKRFIHFNCDLKVASERFLVGLLSFGDRTKEAFKNCEPTDGEDSVIEKIVKRNSAINMRARYLPLLNRDVSIPQRGFDLKANALGRWV